jgi:hypothetical protein
MNNQLLDTDCCCFESPSEDALRLAADATRSGRPQSDRILFDKLMQDKQHSLSPMQLAEAVDMAIRENGIALEKEQSAEASGYEDATSIQQDVIALPLIPTSLRPNGRYVSGELGAQYGRLVVVVWITYFILQFTIYCSSLSD